MAASLVIQRSINVCSPVADFTVSFKPFNETHGEMDFFHLLYCDVYRLCKEYHGVVVNTLSSYREFPGQTLGLKAGFIIHRANSSFKIILKFDTTRKEILKASPKKKIATKTV